jgi:sulfoxide reductase heme-binding subunit YedZ
MAPDIKFAKTLVFVNSLIPTALLCWDGYHGQLGANPLEFITHTTGALTLIFLLLSLTVTPLLKIFQQPWLIKFRRMVGLFAFFYGCLHLITYVWFDKSFAFSAIPHDVAKRPFIAFGMLSFFLMVPLAITSTNKMVRRLGGKRWSRLHKIVYVAAIAGVLHFYLLVKADIRKPVAFAVALAMLLGYRSLRKYIPSFRTGKPAISIRRNPNTTPVLRTREDLKS